MVWVTLPTMMGVKKALPNKARLDMAIRMPRCCTAVSERYSPRHGPAEKRPDGWMVIDTHMHKVEIANARIDQRLKRRHSNALDDARP